jgi:hypothetical protein
VNPTPLRLVAIEENPPAADEQSGAPVTIMSEQDAITRKVPEFDMTVTPDNLPDNLLDKQKRFPSLKILLSAGAIAVVVIVLVVALVVKGKNPATPAPVRAIAAPVSSPGESPQPRPSAAPITPAGASPRLKTGPETIRLGVMAEPMETELSLDGNVVAGHRLNLEVPRDRGIHVVSASAPGYIPFNQQVSFSNDVVLKISLHRAHMPAARQGARARPSPFEARPTSNARPAAVSPGPGLAPGMNLEGPSLRPNTKQIDERNPYKP